MRVDAEGRVYVALYGQGRVLILSREGLPIGQVLLPGRDEGRNLSSAAWPSGPAVGWWLSSPATADAAAARRSSARRPWATASRFAP
ncbi:hypothetical protein ACFQU2_28105 [Siccirubricoccus deserti]